LGIIELIKGSVSNSVGMGSPTRLNKVSSSLFNSSPIFHVMLAEYTFPLTLTFI
jgi:hypothetical protein